MGGQHTRNQYDSRLKESTVKRYLTEKTSIHLLAEEIGCKDETVRQWIIGLKQKVLLDCFNNDINQTRMRDKKSTESLEKEIHRLEEELSMAKLKVEGYEILLSLASKDCGVDLLKKDAAKQLKYSEKNKRK